MLDGKVRKPIPGTDVRFGVLGGGGRRVVSSTST